MVQWRLCLLLAMLLILPDRGSKSYEEEEVIHVRETEEDDDDDDEYEEEREEEIPYLRVPMMTRALVTKAASRWPLECYICPHPNTPLLACLDPTKYRVHTTICPSLDDKCFTSVISKGYPNETVTRGCRSGCVQSSETTCCELRRCNKQALPLPIMTAVQRCYLQSFGNVSDRIPQMSNSNSSNLSLVL